MDKKQTEVHRFFDASRAATNVSTQSSREAESDSDSQPQLGWVRPSVIEARKGITKGALDKKRQRGQLIEKVHWGYSDGVIYYNFEEIDRKITTDIKASKS